MQDRFTIPRGAWELHNTLNAKEPAAVGQRHAPGLAATCHVSVDPQWLNRIRLPEPGSQETSILSFAAAARPNSRLWYQLIMSDALDGLVVSMPEGQH